jgi:hypothetical protein
MSVVVEGRTWNEYQLEWNDADGKLYSVCFFAISREHASYIVEEIKKTGRLADGEVVGKYNA